MTDKLKKQNSQIELLTIEKDDSQSKLQVIYIV